MGRLVSTIFGPMTPKVEAEYLPTTASQLAKDCKMTSGALVPWNLPGAVAGVTIPDAWAPMTLYRFGKDTASKVNYWFKFPGDVNIVRGPIVDDPDERTYWTDYDAITNTTGYPKKTKNGITGAVGGSAVTPGSLSLGVPPPGWAGAGVTPTYTPSITVSGTATVPTSTPNTSTYIVTYVTTWGEESAPSLASAVMTWQAGQTVTITLPGAFSGPYDIAGCRIYRSNTGSKRASFQLVNKTTLTSVSGTYADSVFPGDSLGEGCPTFDWLPPPNEMIGLTDMGNGVLAGFKGNTVYFCEPEYPYAWPATYDSPLSAPVVGMACFGQTLVVGTTDGLVLFTGTDPASMSQESPKGSQACVSKRSMVEMLGGVVYAAPDGLILVGPGITRNLTADLLSRDDWQAYKPSSIHAHAVNGRYYAFYDTGTVKGCLIFQLENDPGLVLSDQWCSAAYVEDRLDSLFLVKQAGSVSTLYEWDTGTAGTAIWRSKAFRFHSGTTLSAAVVKASSYPVTFKLFAEGDYTTPKYTYSVPNDQPFRLPDGRNYVVAYQIESAVKVTSVRVASSMRELSDG